MVRQKRELFALGGVLNSHTNFSGLRLFFSPVSTPPSGRALDKKPARWRISTCDKSRCCCAPFEIERTASRGSCTSRVALPTWHDDVLLTSYSDIFRVMRRLRLASTGTLEPPCGSDDEETPDENGIQCSVCLVPHRTDYKVSTSRCTCRVGEKLRVRATGSSPNQLPHLPR